MKNKTLELKERTSTAGPIYETKQRTYVRETKVVQGRTMTYLRTKTIDMKDEMAKFNADDFRLESLIETGAINNMPQMMMLQSTLNMTDAMENGAGEELARMDAEEWAQKYLETTKTKKGNNK